MGGCQHGTRSVLWGRGLPIKSDVKYIGDIWGFALKYIYLDCDLINYYFDHLIM